MRIISGTARGRKLTTPRGDQIRPTADRAREALFSILSGAVLDCHFVDLFAGTGGVGLEALSRGAASCVFVDNNKKACGLVHQNSMLCNLDSGAVILKRDLRRDPHYLKKCTPAIDILFMDPPYNQGFSKPLFAYFDANPSIFTADALLIIEESADVSLPDNGHNFKLDATRIYGEAVFWIYSKTTSNQ